MPLSNAPGRQRTPHIYAPKGGLTGTHRRDKIERTTEVMPLIMAADFTVIMAADFTTTKNLVVAKEAVHEIPASQLHQPQESE